MRVCLVCPSAWPVLAPGEQEFAGGAEFQLLMLATALRDRGHEVSWVVGDFGQPRRTEVRGFEVHSSFRMFEGNRKMRFVPDMWSLRQAIRRARPELVNQRSTAFYTGQVCRFAHEAGAAFVFSLGIDYNCYPDLMGRAPRPIQWLYRWGLRNADGVLAQTEEQRALVRQNFGVESGVLPNMLELPPPRREAEDQGYVLWVGSLARRKRPELFVELARRHPGVAFRLVGGPGEDPGYDEEVRRLARGIGNLEVVGFVPPDEVAPLYRGASVYLNSSRLEGLPNAFLQAWSQGVPALSASVDPDGVISRGELGILAGPTVDELSSGLSRLLSDEEFRLACGRRAREHVARAHDITHVGDLAEQHLLAARSKFEAE